MIYLRGHLARPLDSILGVPSRLAVLRALYAAPDGLSGRRAARLSGINHQAAALALKALEGVGVVARREGARSPLWRLDRRRELVSKILLPLFQGEGRNADGIAGEIKDRVGRRADAVVIVGEAAKGKLAPGKPLELIVLCDLGKRRALNDALRELERDLEERYALRLKIDVLQKREAHRRLDILDGWQLLPTEGRPSIFTGGR